MNWRVVYGLLVVALVVMAQPAWAELGCRAVQISCLPELGLFEARVVTYDEALSCRHSEAELKQLTVKGIYPLKHADALAVAADCGFKVGKVRMEIASYIENKDEQGHCGDYGPVPVVNMWLDKERLMKEVPLQSCRTDPAYDAEAVVFRQGEDSYSLSFGGDIEPQHNYYSFNRVTRKPNGFALPVTKGTILGKGRDAFKD